MSDYRGKKERLADVLARCQVRIEAARLEPEDCPSPAEQRRIRTDRLHKLGISLHRSVHDKVLSNTGLLELLSETGPLEGRSLITAQAFMARAEPILALVGCAGCGKSVAAASCAVNFEGTCAWTTSPKLVRLAAASFGPEALEYRKLLGAELAIVDDVATEGDPVRECAALIEFIDARKHRKSIWTSNIAQSSEDETVETWETRFRDPRLHSRLKESVVFVYDDGPDLRGLA